MTVVIMGCSNPVLVPKRLLWCIAPGPLGQEGL